MQTKNIHPASRLLWRGSVPVTFLGTNPLGQLRFRASPNVTLVVRPEHLDLELRPAC